MVWRYGIATFPHNLALIRLTHSEEICFMDDCDCTTTISLLSQAELKKIIEILKVWSIGSFTLEFT